MTTPNSSTGATSCNFEAPSICGFTQDHSGRDQFNWTRDNAGTQSADTGPQVDHTLGTYAGETFIFEM